MVLTPLTPTVLSGFSYTFPSVTITTATLSGRLTAGTGDEQHLFQETTGQLIDARAGTALVGDPIAHPLIKATRTVALPASLSGNVAEVQAAILGISKGVDGNAVQVTGIAGIALNASTTVDPRNDSAGGYFFAQQTGAGMTNAAEGLFAVAVQSVATAYAQGIEIQIRNAVADDTAVQNGYPLTLGLGITPGSVSTNKNVGAAIMIGRGDVPRFDVGLIFPHFAGIGGDNLGPTVSADIRSLSSAAKGLEFLAISATLTTALTGTNNDLKYTAVTAGTPANSIRVSYVAGAPSTASTTAAVSTNDITVTLATDGSGTIIATAAQVAAAVAADSTAPTLVTVANASGNDGTGVVTAMAFTNLSGGLGTHTSGAIVVGPGTGGVVIGKTSKQLAASVRLEVWSSDNTTGNPLVAIGAVTGSTNQLLQFRNAAGNTRMGVSAGGASAVVSGLAAGDFVLQAQTAGKAVSIVGGSAILAQFTNADTIGFFGATPAARPTAYTQTYATATRTHSNLTSADLTGISSSTTGSALAEPSATYTQAEMQQNFRRIQDQFVALRADLTNVKGVLNSAIDDDQTLGLKQ